MQVLASAMSPEQAPSAEMFYLVKMQQVQGLMSSEVDEYQGMTVIYHRSTSVILTLP